MKTIINVSSEDIFLLLHSASLFHGTTNFNALTYLVTKGALCFIQRGDFNAHLGPAWGPRAHNLQGTLLAEVLDRCILHVPSLSNASLGPNYTYQSRSTTTTVDYILADFEASSCIDHCQIHEEADLNSSDDLPLSITLSCHIPTQFPMDT